MKITTVELSQEKDGLQPFKIPMLGNLVLITGGNGAGKTRLLKMIQSHVSTLQNQGVVDSIDIQINEDNETIKLTSDNAEKVKIINYSHYDARLQSPNSFAPYVIHKAKDILKSCDYEETALNSLLFIEDMAKGYSDEYKNGDAFEEFKNGVAKDFNLKLDYDKEENRLSLFDLDIDKASLSPGQQYLLRMAVACFQNEDKPGLIFFLDEPELHLHPKLLIELVEKLRQKFPKSQFWISTHSLSLISFYTIMCEEATTLYLENGRVEPLRSNSSRLLEGLVGSEDNQFAVQQLFDLPDQYACNRFTFECFDEPKTLPGKDGNDKEVELVRDMLSVGDIIVDYGAGKGRFLEELELGGHHEINYYAYDCEDKDAPICKKVMNKYGSTENNYYNDIEKLQSEIGGRAKYVLLVNVLHEIPPRAWTSVFDNIRTLLCEDGRLIIVERDELMVGEAPYEQGFMMLTSNSAYELFGQENVEEVRHPQKKYIVKYIVKKNGLQVGAEAVQRCIQTIKEDTLSEIDKVKNSSIEERDKRFKVGMKLVFLLHQYANASLILNEIE